MSNQIFYFAFCENQNIRTALIDEEPWFVAKDICENLGYAIPHKAIRDHVFKEDVLKRITPTKSGNQNMLWVNEAGLYALIFGSKLEGAEKFKWWVQHEVLPAIRKHGAYIAPHKEDDKSFIETFKNFCLQHNYSAREVEMFNWFGEMKLKQGYAIAMSKVEKEREEVKEQQPRTLPVPYDDVKRILLLAAYLSDRYNRYVNAVAAIRELISSLNIIKEDISDLAYLGDIQMPLLKQKLLDLPFTDEQRKEIEHALRPWAVESNSNNK